MSSRALRKAQRQREEEANLQHLNHVEAGDEDEEEEIVTMPAKQSAFAMLDAIEDADADENRDDNEDDELDGGVDIDANEFTAASKPKTKGKKKKKKKAKKTKAPDESTLETLVRQDEGLDEIDEALKQLATSTNGTSLGTTVAGEKESTVEMFKLLAIETNHLHAQNEMRRLFGRAALEQHDDDEQGPQNENIGGNRRQQRRIQQVGLAQALRGRGGPGGRAGGLTAIALRRNIFIQGKDEWPMATGGGLGMEVEEKRADGSVLYRFVHNRTYQDVQAQFGVAVETMDPNQLIALLQHNPYHISTLLQVSEIAKQERDHAVSGDLLERALFSFGRAVHSTFAKTLAEGKARLDFARPENREFWLASWRFMQNLSMRATWRTVYEWAKLLLSLAPEGDPYAMWLVLDQYALRARQDLDYLNLSRNPVMKDVHKSSPNVELSQGLAEFRAGNKNKGQQALFQAAGRYPWVVARMMQELALDPPPAIWGKEPRTEKEKLDAELYATRAKDLWNTPETAALLLEITSALPPDTPATSPDTQDISISTARHVILFDTPSLIALVPRKYTAALLSSSDPLPPPSNNPSYSSQSARQAHLPRDSAATSENDLRELHGLYGFFSQLFPWFRPGEDVEAPPEEEVQTRIQESGVDQHMLEDRTRRLMELQDRLLHAQPGDPAQREERLAAGGGRPTDEERSIAVDGADYEGQDQRMRASVEDAPEEDN